MNQKFANLGRWLHRHRIAVAIAWMVLTAVAALGAARLPAALLEGTAEIPGSVSQRVDHVLASDFDNPFTRTLIVTLSSNLHVVTDPTYRSWLERAKRILGARPEVAQTVSYLDRPDSHLRSKDGHEAIVMVGLAGTTLQQQQAAVPVLRAALAPLGAQMASEAGKLAVTGHAAIEYDIDSHSQRDCATAEERVLLPSLLILLWAFRSPVAAAIPLVVAMVGVTISLCAAYLLTFFLPVSSFLENMVTMVGLAVGIDYSLFIVSRFRESLARSHDVETAVAEVAAHSGPAILCSGITVMIGLLALLFTPLVELRSMGIGGSMVVVVSVAAALTLVPAVLGILGHRIDAARLVPGTTLGLEALTGPGKPSGSRWRKLAQWVMKRPGRVLGVGLAAVLLLAAPASRMHLAFSDARWLPANLESRQGLDVLAKLGQANSVDPIYSVVHSTDGRSPLSLAHVPELTTYAAALKNDRRVGEVLSPVTMQKGLSLLDYLLLFGDLDRAVKEYPLLGKLFLSRDHMSVLFEIVPRDGVRLNDLQALAHKIAAIAPGPGLRVAVGGEPVYYSDFNTAMLRSYPIVMTFVVGITLLVLFATFRSVLLPLKAVVMNLLSVAAGLGAIVAVFQMGWGGRLVGVDAPLGAILSMVPMLIFCVTFGLSMDYEVFLLSRIQEAYDRTGDNEQATIEGLALTGGIITSAALLMVVVFGAFASTEIVIVKMIGFGEAVTVAVDATLIRIFLVPAFMKLAGQWNWKPGRRPSGASAIAKPAIPTV